MKWTIWISILLLCLTGIGEVQAQNDPVLAGMIAVYTEKAEKELKNQEKVMTDADHRTYLDKRRRCRRQQTCNESLIII